MTSRKLTRVRRQTGAGLIEVLFVLALGITLAGIAAPMTAEALDEMRAASAARYLATRIGAMRIDALKRSTCAALRFERAGDDYSYAAYVDGNANGVRTADISAGVDVRVGPLQRLSDAFPGVQFGLGPGLPDADGQGGTGTDGVRIGSARILTMSPDGSATPGTLYLRGRRGQYAVRVLGATGRTRVLQYHAGTRQWISR